MPHKIKVDVINNSQFIIPTLKKMRNIVDIVLRLNFILSPLGGREYPKGEGGQTLKY
jgi:hypothetical protein